MNRENISIYISDFGAYRSPRHDRGITDNGSTMDYHFSKEFRHIRHKEFTIFIGSDMVLCPSCESIGSIFFYFHMSSSYIPTEVVWTLIFYNEAKYIHIKSLGEFYIFCSDDKGIKLYNHKKIKSSENLELS